MNLVQNHYFYGRLPNSTDNQQIHKFEFPPSKGNSEGDLDNNSHFVFPSSLFLAEQTAGGKCKSELHVPESPPDLRTCQPSPWDVSLRKSYDC